MDLVFGDCGCLSVGCCLLWLGFVLGYFCLVVRLVCLGCYLVACADWFAATCFIVFVACFSHIW